MRQALEPSNSKYSPSLNPVLDMPHILRTSRSPPPLQRGNLRRNRPLPLVNVLQLQQPPPPVLELRLLHAQRRQLLRALRRRPGRRGRSATAGQQGRRLGRRGERAGGGGA